MAPLNCNLVGGDCESSALSSIASSIPAPCWLENEAKIIDLPNGVDIESVFKPGCPPPELLRRPSHLGNIFCSSADSLLGRASNILIALLPVAKIFNGSPGHRR